MTAHAETPRAYNDRSPYATLCGMPYTSIDEDSGDCVGSANNVDCWRCVHLLCSRPLPAEPSCPEHDKLHKAKDVPDATQLVYDFLEWLQGEKRMQLGRWGGDRGDYLTPVGIHPSKLLAEFFGISEEKLESEKVALLEHQRAINKAVDWAKREGRKNLRGR